MCTESHFDRMGHIMSFLTAMKVELSSKLYDQVTIIKMNKLAGKYTS